MKAASVFDRDRNRAQRFHFADHDERLEVANQFIGREQALGDLVEARHVARDYSDREVEIADLAFPAVFLVLLRGMWTSAGAALPWLVSLLVAAGVYLAVPGAWYVPAGTVAGIGITWVRRRS